MEAKTRFLLGGIGGITPVVLFLVNLDFDDYVANASTLKTLGYCVRAVLLFLLGGFVAYLHKVEKREITLFLVGVSAPSLIAGYISTAPQRGQLDAASQPVAAVREVASASAFSLFFPSAYAQTKTSVPDDIKRFTLPPQKGSEDFWSGLVGRRPKNIYFVIVGSHLDIVEARKQVTLLRTRFPAYTPNIYAPYGDNPYYAVVIGSNLSQAEAKLLRDRAVRDGFPRDSYFKTFPGLPPAP